jgi:hypothetical protein
VHEASLRLRHHQTVKWNACVDTGHSLGSILNEMWLRKTALSDISLRTLGSKAGNLTDTGDSLELRAPYLHNSNSYSDRTQIGAPTHGYEKTSYGNDLTLNQP